MVKGWILNLKHIAQAYDNPEIIVGNDSISTNIIGDTLHVAVAGSNGHLRDWLGRKGNVKLYQKYIDQLQKTASRGFAESAMDCFNEIKHIKADKLNISGHSRGGPLASIIACLMHEDGLFNHIDLTTFGAPMWTTDKAYDKYHFIRNSTRVVSAGDKIPDLPPRSCFSRFIHFGNQYTIGRLKNRHAGSFFDYYDAHMLATYQYICYEMMNNND
jgi:hypothetical protein